MMSGVNLAAAVKQKALEIGFDLVGIAPLGVWEDLKFSRQWVERGYGGEMRYLRNPKRDDPRSLLPSAKSVICVGLVYNTAYPYSTQAAQEGSRQKAVGSKQKPERRQGEEAPRPVSSFEFRLSAADDSPRAWISRYAWGQDYHGLLRAKLEQLRAAVENLGPRVETRAYVDTGPVVECAFARHSGMGWMGKNTCIINEGKGSWFFLGVMLVNLELAPDLPAPDRCGSCTRCLEACPTGALVEPYVMNASRCISYFTIELSGSIPEEFRSRIGANVFGCDICQDVCPWNSRERFQVSGDRGQEKTPSGPLQHKEVNEVAQAHSLGPSVNEAGFPSRPSPPVGETVPRLVGAGEGVAPDKGTTNNRRPAATTLLPQFQPLVIGMPSTEHPSQLTTRDGQPTTETLFHPPLEALAALTEDDFHRLFARSPIKRTKYRGWLRNLCVVMANSGDRRFVPWLERAARHPDPIIREHAAWALEHLHRT
jgi:epoxyqueuosine reductase